METEYEVIADGIRARVAMIKDPNDFVPIYRLDYPRIEKATAALLDSIREQLVTEMEISSGQILDPEEIGSLKEKFLKRSLELIEEQFPRTSAEKKEILGGILLHNSLGLGKIEMLLQDQNLEEIVINNSREPVWVYSRKAGWLKTNIFVPSDAEIYNYAAMIGRRVGSQITYLNPLMDAYLVTGDRSNATLFPISSKGNTLTIRKFSRRPWVITDFIELNTVSPQIAAFLWLAIQYEMNVLISGGTASGKTGLLNVLSCFIPPNQRIITIEDSVTGDAELLVRKNGKIRKIRIEDLFREHCKERDFDGSIKADGIEVLTADRDLKIKWTKPSLLIRHKTSKDIYEVVTATGRKVKVTKDHSLFTLGKDGRLEEITPEKLSKGSFLATPRSLPSPNRKMGHIDLSCHIKDLGGFVYGEMIGDFLGKSRPSELKVYGISKSNLQYYRREKMVPSKILERIIASGRLDFSFEERKKLSIGVKGPGIRLPLILEITDDLLRLFGLWVGDGSYDRRNQNRVIITTGDKECEDLVQRVGKSLGIGISRMSDGFSLSLNSVMLYRVMRYAFGFDGHSATKRIPPFVFSLSGKQIARLLEGYFSADGTVKPNEVSCSSQSKGLLSDIQTLLLMNGIISRIGRYKRKDRCIEMSVSSVENASSFFKNIGFLQKRKMDKLSFLGQKQPTHSSSDVVPLRGDWKKLNSNPWYFSNWNMGRKHLQGLVGGLDFEDEDLYDLAYSDIYWDRVVEVSKTGPKAAFVYDISVPSTEKFIANNFFLHNTREIQIPKFLHWVPLTTRPHNPEGKGEVTMLELLINSLRMRPDRILVGEMRRGREAEVLFEAIHTGHSVYATLHANTAEETVRRLVNPPINIPMILLGSLHLIAVMHRDRRRGIRRLIQVSEIASVDVKSQVQLNDVFGWNPSSDAFYEIEKPSRVLNEIEFYTGMSQPEIKADLKEKEKVLNWLVKEQIKDINKVGEIISTYYTNKAKILGMVNK